MGLSRRLSGEDLPPSEGNAGSICGSGGSLGEGNGNPLQYSCLKNPMDSGTWQDRVYGIAKQQQALGQFSSVFQSCPTLCNPVDCCTPSFPIYHQLPEPAQTHVHLVSDAIQPSHPLSSPFPPAFNPFQYQGLFQ